MTVQIPQWLENKGYTALRDRGFLGDFFGEGVLGTSAMEVTNTSGMGISVAAGVAYITGDDQPNQGRYRVENIGAISFTLGAAHASLTRTDIVICRVRDANPTGSGSGGQAGDDGAIQVLAGTAGGSAQAVPASAIKLADCVVPALATSPNITDSRAMSEISPYNPLVVPEVFPTGFVGVTAGASAPSGWVLTDGASYAVGTAGSTYYALHQVIQYTYGGSGANFNVPDLRGRVVVSPNAASTPPLALAGTEGRSLAARTPKHSHWHQVDVPTASGTAGGPQLAGHPGTVSTTVVDIYPSYLILNHIIKL